jgi:hypothetical protein
MHCPAETAQTTLVLTMTAAREEIVVRAREGACGWGGAVVRRGGERQGPAVDVSGMSRLLGKLVSRAGG